MNTYNLHWRNLTVDWVNWEKDTLRFVYDNGKAMTVMFRNIRNHIDSSSDEQCIKMIMDRYIVNLFSKMLHPSKEIMDYILDIFQHPYEWNTKLLEELR